MLRSWFNGALSSTWTKKEDRRWISYVFLAESVRGKRQIHGIEKAAKESHQSVSQIPHQTVVLLILRTCWQARARLEFCWDSFQWLKSGFWELHKFLCLRTFNLRMFIDDSHSSEQKLVRPAYCQQMLSPAHCDFGHRHCAVSGSGSQIVWPQPTFYILIHKNRHI